MRIQRVKIDRLRDGSWQHFDQAPLLQVLFDFPEGGESDSEPEKRPRVRHIGAIGEERARGPLFALAAF